MLSTQLIILRYPVILYHRRNIALSAIPFLRSFSFENLASKQTKFPSSSFSSNFSSYHLNAGKNIDMKGKIPIRSPLGMKWLKKNKTFFRGMMIKRNPLSSLLNDDFIDRMTSGQMPWKW